MRRPQGTYNLGSKNSMSKADFAFALAEELGLKTHYMSRGTTIDSHLEAYRPKNMSMDSTAFEDALDMCLPTLEEEIKSMKKIYNL